MKRTVCLLISVFLIISFACVCGEELSAYDRIEMSFDFSDITALLGEGIHEGDYVIFSGEAACAFYESGRLRAKAVVFDAITDIAPTAGIPLDNLRKLRQGAHIDEITTLFGCEGLEIMKINLSDEEESGVRRVLAWQTEEKISVQALFELDDGEWVLFAIVESPAPQ